MIMHIIISIVPIHSLKLQMLSLLSLKMLQLTSMYRDPWHVNWHVHLIQVVCQTSSLSVNSTLLIPQPHFFKIKTCKCTYIIQRPCGHDNTISFDYERPQSTCTVKLILGCPKSFVTLVVLFTVSACLRFCALHCAFLLIACTSVKNASQLCNRTFGTTKYTCISK